MNYEKQLFLKYLDGKASLDEKKQILHLLKENGEAKEILQLAYEQWAEREGQSFDPWSSIDHVISKAGTSKRFFLFPALAAAAAAIAAILLITPLRRHNSHDSLTARTELYTLAESEYPQVILPDGRVIRSEAIEMQLSCTSCGVRIDGCDYESNIGAQTRCAVAVPYGHRARVQFADGTSVRLNAHSKMVFPLSFGEVRNVNMTGEALFDVSRDESRPFTVDVDDVKIQVLGTRFLVSGYDDSPRRVALVAGSVNVSIGESQQQSVTLVPNQMYTLDDNGKINVEDVADWGGLLDWTDGVYRADGTSMKNLLSYLGRYYGKNVECDPQVAEIACTGTLYLSSTLSEMLSELSRIFPIKSREQDGVWLVSLSRD